MNCANASGVRGARRQCVGWEVNDCAADDAGEILGDGWRKGDLSWAATPATDGVHLLRIAVRCFAPTPIKGGV